MTINDLLNKYSAITIEIYHGIKVVDIDFAHIDYEFIKEYSNNWESFYKLCYNDEIYLFKSNINQYYLLYYNINSATVHKQNKPISERTLIKLKNRIRKTKLKTLLND